MNRADQPTSRLTATGPGGRRVAPGFTVGTCGSCGHAVGLLVSSAIRALSGTTQQGGG